MNVLCPKCQKLIVVADKEAGQTTTCPQCSFAFPAPNLAPTAGPSGPQPPIPPLEATAIMSEPPSAAAPAEISPWSGPGYQHRRTLWLSPRIAPWIGPLFLAALFVLWFFPWVVLPEQEKVVALNAWELAFRSPVSMLLLFSILLLLPATAASGAALAITLKLVQVQLPRTLEQLWPLRSLLIGGVIAVAFVFMLLQLLTGFDREAALALDASNVYASLAHRTGWLWLAMVCHFLALAGAWLEHWLRRRGDRPWPRIDFSW